MHLYESRNSQTAKADQVNGTGLSFTSRLDVKKKMYVWFSSFFFLQKIPLSSDKSVSPLCMHTVRMPLYLLIYPQEMRNSTCFFRQHLLSVSPLLTSPSCLAMSVLD